MMNADEVAEIRRRRPAMRATLACEGMYLTDEEEAIFDEMEKQGLSQEQRIERLRRYNDEKLAEEAGDRTVR